METIDVPRLRRALQIGLDLHAATVSGALSRSHTVALLDEIALAIGEPPRASDREREEMVARWARPSTPSAALRAAMRDAFDRVALGREDGAS